MTESQKSDETARPADGTESAEPSTESVPGTESAPSTDSVPSPTPAGPRPTPTPAAMAPKPGAAPSPSVAAPPAHVTPLSEAAKWARVEEDGHVFLLVNGEEFPVGQYPDAPKDEALAYFVRKFDDAASQIMLLEQRVQAKAPVTDMQKTVEHMRELVKARHMVGDVVSLEARLDTLTSDIQALEQAERAQQEEAKAVELAAREALVAEAEEIAGKDPATVQWKTSSQRMTELFEAWKTSQKSGLRLGRGVEDSLWKRFRAARTVFDRHRRAYFSQLDSDNASAKAAKEALIARAEELATSTDWGQTAGEYRRLMDEWKSSKRASRKDDDALWTRFRAAQDRFFAARQAANEAVDQEYSANLTVKEELLAEAKALLPVKDPAAARKALQSIRDRWEDAGKVPRADMGRMDSGLRTVEDAVKAAEDEHWKRSNPETKARTNSALSQLDAAIESLEDDLARAKKAGDTRKIAKAQEALDARLKWREALQQSAQHFS